jgi:thiamine pyrophosphate-dependent acetolactate synthase large subunit-like protein/nitrite reductase/ring-hydroxylating ferredoxin subunit
MTDHDPAPADGAGGGAEPADGTQRAVVWHKVAEPADLPEGRVRTVTVDGRSLALSRHRGRCGALDNRCPHQGGPLGEGTIEGDLLRCPWHGYDYDPITGRPPPPFTDAPDSFDVEERPDGVYVALPPRAPHERTVSDVMVETLLAWGVTHVFGMVGHSNLGFADAMRRAEQRGELTYVGIRHEGAAAFAASAYGKLTGRPAACFAIAGPGSTNLLTGLYDAKVDGAPTLAISGQVPSKVRGRGAFQDLDLSAAFGDVAVWSQSVAAGSDHAEMATLAVKHAIDGRGVAHLVLPDEVQELPSTQDAGGPEGRDADRRVAPDAGALGEAVRLVAAARRPILVVGHGARRSVPQVLRLAERLKAPVVTTFKAKGLVGDHHPHGAGVLGRSGTPVASWLMNESDLVIALGVSFSNHTGIADYKPIVQVDDDPGAIGRFHAVTCGVLGEVGVALDDLCDALPEATAALDQRHDLAERWQLWREEKRRRRADDRDHGVSSAALFDSLSRTCPDDAVLCVDVGNNTYSFGRYFESTGNQAVLMSGYLGSIGFALPAALGAWAAAPERPIVSISGDGGLGQYLAELTTAVKYGIPVRHVVLDNSSLGKITKEQRAAELDVWQTSLHNPDFADYARLCGATGIRVASIAELDGALAEAFATDGPVLVHVLADAELI